MIRTIIGNITRTQAYAGQPCFNFAKWQARIRAAYPVVLFTTETGAGETYGDIGETTAHVGPDMQDDVVGVWRPPQPLHHPRRIDGRLRGGRMTRQNKPRTPMRLAQDAAKRTGFIQYREPAEVDDQGQPVPAGPWQTFCPDPLDAAGWRKFVSGNERYPALVRVGSTDVFLDITGNEYRYVQA